MPTTRIRLDIAYHGGAFRGWSKQPGLRTVQGELESALATIFHRYGAPPTLTVAGRTDAGVHALGQVAHLDLTDEQLAGLARAAANSGHAKPVPEVLATRINGIAGSHADVYVRRAAQAPPGFDARFSALWRRYEYRVADQAGPRNPLERSYTLWHPRALDTLRMDRAASALVGLHDWAAYCRARDGATTVRTLYEFGWTRDPDGVLVARVKADAFCHGMVRALVGASIAVGEGKLGVDAMTGIRDAAERTSAFKVVPARGLVLLEVGYPDDADLGMRALQTRARRAPIETPHPVVE